VVVDDVFRHEVEGALEAALDRLPAFDRQPLRRAGTKVISLRV
jgi:hypothetical protein